MERNNVVGDTIYIGELEFKTFLRGYIVAYKFHNQNNLPSKIVFPAVTEFEGVSIEKEEKVAVTSGKSKSR